MKFRLPYTLYAASLWLGCSSDSGIGSDSESDGGSGGNSELPSGGAHGSGGASAGDGGGWASGGLNNSGGAAAGGGAGGAGGSPGNGGSGGDGGAHQAGGATSSGGQVSNEAVLLEATFDARSAGVYSQDLVASDFGAAPSWNDGLDEGRAGIVPDEEDPYLRVTYPAGEYGPADGGVQFIVPLGDSYEELYLSYRIRFRAGFDFAKGGKLPGLVGGSAPTGCVVDETGFSARMMWRTGGLAVQYLYFPDKIESCGDDYEYQVAEMDARFTPGKWHVVLHRIVMNTPGQPNGVMQAWFDGALALDHHSFVWRKAGAGWAIDALYFSTFFGGSDATWAPNTDQTIDYDDFIVSTAPIEQ